MNTKWMLSQLEKTIGTSGKTSRAASPNGDRTNSNSDHCLFCHQNSILDIFSAKRKLPKAIWSVLYLFLIFCQPLKTMTPTCPSRELKRILPLKSYRLAKIHGYFPTINHSVISKSTSSWRTGLLSLLVSHLAASYKYIARFKSFYWEACGNSELIHEMIISAKKRRKPEILSTSSHTEAPVDEGLSEAQPIDDFFGLPSAAIRWFPLLSPAPPPPALSSLPSFLLLPPLCFPSFFVSPPALSSIPALSSPPNPPDKNHQWPSPLIRKILALEPLRNNVENLTINFYTRGQLHTGTPTHLSIVCTMGFRIVTPP